MMRKILFLILALALFTAPAAPGLAADVYPICEPGELTLTIMVVAHPAIADWDTNAMTRWMEEQTGVKIEWQTVPLEGRAEAFQMALAGNEYPDAFMLPYGNTMTADLLNKYGVDEKRLAPLNDLIDHYMPNLKAAFDENPGYEDMMRMLDGNIYSLPTINQCYHCTLATKMWINQAWLTKLNLEMPATIDELYDVLVAFRDNDPNGNGLQDEIPLAGAYINGWNIMPEYFLMNSFTYYDCYLQSNLGDKYPLGFYLDGDTVKAPFAEPGFLEGLQFMRKLVEEGLMYDGVFTMDDQALVNLVENPDAELVGLVAGGYGGCFCNMDGDRYKDYVALMPVAGPAGLRQIVVDPYDLGLAGVAISADSPNKEAAAKWFDLLYSFEGTTNGYYGPEGEAWRVAEEGETGINGKPALYTQLKPWQEVEPQSDHWVQACISYRNSDWRLGMAYDQSIDLYSGDGLEALLYKVSEEMAQYADPARKMPPVKFTSADADIMSIPKVEVGSLIKEYIPSFMSGAFSIEKDYQNFLDKLDAAGLPLLLEKHQQAYDDQFKK